MTGAANDSPAGSGGRTGRSGEEERMLTLYTRQRDLTSDGPATAPRVPPRAERRP